MKTIFITGASSGIGLATAKLFARSEWNVIATTRRPEEGNELSSLPNVRTLALDVMNAAQIRDVVADVVGSYEVDVLFNNAGTMLAGPLEAFTDQQMVDVVAANLLGQIRVTQAFVPHFREKRSGLVINTTSLSALVASPFMSVYAATKAGLERWSFAMNLELDEFGIRVKTIVPGVVKTSLAANAVMESSAPYAERIAKFVSVLGDPEKLPFASTSDDIAKVVFQAATDETDQIRYLADGFAESSVAGIAEHGEEMVQKAGAQQLFA